MSATKRLRRSNAMALRSWLANFFGRDPADERKIAAIVEKLRADGAEADFRSAEDAERAVASAAAADARRAALDPDSDSDSGEEFLGRVGADLFEDDETPRRRPTRRGWTPGFHDVVDRGVTSFKVEVGGHKVSCKLGYRESGTGSSVWDGAVVLARFLETHPHLVCGKMVLELGAGTGFGGLCAAALGASNVTLTDIEACLPLLRENAAGVDGVVVEALDWTEPVPSGVSCDVVIAADCLLPGREGLFAPLATTLAALLAGDAVAYFVYEQRCMDCGPFFDLLRGAGVSSKRIPDDDLHPEYRAPEIRVLALRRT